MNTTFINLNNVWTEILVVSVDAEQTFSPIIEDGDRRYYVTPYRDFIEDGKHYYWFIINSKEVVNAELKEQINQLKTQLGIIDYDTTTLDGAKQAKLREISTACQTTIYAGVDVQDTKGTEHFSLTSDDQANLSALAMAIGTGLTSVPYHADGQLCREFTASEFNSIYTAAKNFVTYNTTLCNHLNVWIRRCTIIEDVSAITYTSTLPNDLLVNFNTIIGINK